jgi:hypothetical protein
MRGLRGKTFRQSGGVETQEVDGIVFLIAPESGSIHHLDALSAAIWKLYAAPRNLAEIEEILTSAFPDAEPAKVSRDLRRFFDMLRDYDLICEAGGAGD